MFVPGKPFQVLPSRVGSRLTHKHRTRLERLARDKHSSLLQTFLDYDRKKFCNSETCGQCYKTFMVVNTFLVLHFYGRLLVSPANIRPSWKGFSGTNALAYYEKLQLTAVKSFITLAPGGRDIPGFPKKCRKFLDYSV
jgi:hypothetical protein